MFPRHQLGDTASGLAVVPGWGVSSAHDLSGGNLQLVEGSQNSPRNTYYKS